MSQRCLSCFGEYADGVSACPHCGYQEGKDEQEHGALPLRTVLNSRYIIGMPLGQGGFGITYAAWDSLLEKKVAIKEYLPGDFASRAYGSACVRVFNPDSAGKFSRGVESFLNESRRLAKFNSVPGIVSIFDCFNANNTAYIVMEFLEGKTLGQLIREKGKLPYDEAVYIMAQVLDALDAVHKEHIIHRDIAPDNIFLCHDGKVRLIDFGAARFVTTSHSRSLSMILKMGYAPVEQYSSRGNQGPWTDVYACSATLYYAITGVRPVDSYDRMDATKDDKLPKPSKYAKKLPKNVETAILNAMNVLPENRTQTAKEFSDALKGTINVRRVKEKLEHEDTGRIPAWMKVNSALSIIGIVAVAVILTLATFIVKQIVSSVPDGMARVPNLIALESPGADTMLKDSSLKMIITGRVFDSYFDELSVVNQNPGAGSLAFENSIVNVTLSGQRENQVIMPEVTYCTKDAAWIALQQLELSVESEEDYDETVAEGCVIRQSVKTGSVLHRGDSVLLTVCKKPEEMPSPDEGMEKTSEVTRQHDTSLPESKEEEIPLTVVPELVGCSREEAVELLSAAHLKLMVSEIVYGAEGDGQDGAVLSQSVAAGESVQENTVIALTEYVAVRKVIVPDMLYLTQSEAVGFLSDAGLKYRTSVEKSENVAYGLVIRQVPPPGSVLLPGAKVTVFVSSGWVVEVPDLSGKNESDAKALLMGIGLSYRVVYEQSGTVEKRDVIRQSPSSGVRIEQGTIVELTVSSGSKKIDMMGVKLSTTKLRMSKGEKHTLYHSYKPKNATNTAVIWHSSDSSVASVDSNGVVTALKVGAAEISVRTVDGGFTEKCVVTVLKSVTAIEVVEFKDKYFIGDTLEPPQVMAHYDDDSSDEVSKNCTFEGFDTSKAGSSSINISYKYRGQMMYTSCDYIVERDRISFGNYLYEISVGNGSLPHSVRLGIHSLSGRKNLSVSFSSSHPQYVKVDDNGTATAEGIGISKISAVYTDPAGNRDVCYCYVRSWSAPTDWVITYDSSGETENTYSPPGDWCMSIRNKWEWKGQKVINEFFVVKLSSPEEQLKEGSTLSFNGEKWIVSYSDVYSTDQELYASYSVYRVISSTGWNDESVSINYDEYDVVNWRCKEILAYTYSNSSLGV